MRPIKYAFWPLLPVVFLGVTREGVLHAVQDAEKVQLHNIRARFTDIDRVRRSAVRESHRVCGFGTLADVTRNVPSPKSGYRPFDIQEPQDEVGDIQTFNAIDFQEDEQRTRQVVARAERKGEHAYIYVDTTATFRNSDLDALIELFDDRIYPTSREVFGEEPNPGIDDDPRITLLFLDIDEPATVVGDIAGYFWPVNQFRRSRFSNSNEREMLYIDVSRLNRFGVEDAAGTIAHEFQHLIHWNHDRDEETWINEGLSEYAIFRNDLGFGNNPAIFLEDTDFTLMSWSNHPRDYARTFLWVLYLVDHYGGDELAREIVANPGNGTAALSSILSVRAPGLTLKDIFGHWVVANFLDFDDDAIYGYLSLRLSALRPTVTYGFLPVSRQQARVNAYAADYYLFAGGEELIIPLKGPEADPDFRARVLKLRDGGTPEVEDFPLAPGGEGTKAFPDFGSTFDRVVLLPYYTGDPATARFADYEFEAQGSGGPSTFPDTLRYHDTKTRTIIADLGLPSRVFNGERFDSYAVRFTPPEDVMLLGAELAVWRRTGTGGMVRAFVYDDTMGAPNRKIDSVDVADVSGEPGFITWNPIDFRSKNISFSKGEDFHIAWEFVDAGFGDTVFTILDTARVPTDRSSILVRERQSWAKFVNGFNFFLRAIVAVPADPTVPKLTAGILQNPVFSQAVDVFAISEKELNPVSVEGALTLADSTVVLNFQSISDENKVFADRDFTLFASGTVDLVISARHKFGTVAGRDSLRFDVSLITPQSGGQAASSDGHAMLAIPPEAVNQPVYLTVVDLEDHARLGKAIPPMNQTNYKATELAYNIGPANLLFEEMAELTFHYEGHDAATLAENNLAIAVLEEEGWRILGGELYREQKRISTLINQTGSYALIIKELESTGGDALPTDFYLEQNYPNPFNPSTTIRFGLPRAAHVTLRVFNLKGQVIATLVDEPVQAGEHSVTWAATDLQNNRVASGVYLYQLIADDYTETKKLVLVR